MRLSPDARRHVYIDGLEHASPLVTVVVSDGESLPLEPGHSPRWTSNDAIVWGPQTDALVRSASSRNGWTPSDAVPATPSGNTVDAAGGCFAVHRTDPRRVLSNIGPVQYDATHPVYAGDGDFRVVSLPDYPSPGVATLQVARADGSDPRDLMTGGVRSVRGHGHSFAWELDGGRIAGLIDCSNRNVVAEVFPLDGWNLSKPVPVWHDGRGELGVLFVADDGTNGHVYYATWVSLQAGTPLGFPVGSSTGSGYDHDVKPYGNGLRVLYADPLGNPIVRDLDLDAPRETLTPPGTVVPEPPQPEPGPEPPEPEPGPEPPEPGPEPEPPTPEDGDMNPTVDQIPRDQTVMAADAIDLYLRENPRLGLPDGIWPAEFYEVGNAERLDVISAYLIGSWCPEVCRLGPFPGDAPGWEVRRNQGLDHTFHVIEAERGEQPAPPDVVAPGTLRGPIGTDRRFFTVPN